MLVTTIHGDMDSSLLEHRGFVMDNDNEHTEVTEFWLKDELVHRSAHVRLKKGLGIETALGRFS